MKHSKKYSIQEWNKIRPTTNFVFNIIFFILAAISIIPVFYIFMISISSEESIHLFGYKFIPSTYSAESYRFLFKEIGTILQALLISILVSVIGTILGLFLTSSLAFSLSRSNFKLKGFITMVVFIPMIFNGGMIASYVVNTQLLHLKNTLWALILPACLSSFNVIICRTYFQQNIPDSIIESVQMDGANNFLIYVKFILPLSLPVLATIALFLAFCYWNDWFLSSLYITDSNLYSLQALLDHVQRNIEMMAKNPDLGVSIQQYLASMPKEGARMAIAIIIIIPIACTYPFFQKYFISGLTIGAVKG